MWGPLTNPSQDLTKWEKHPIETLHAELCKNILHVPRHTTNNACRAELGKYPLITKIQKRAINFWKHTDIRTERECVCVRERPAVCVRERDRVCVCERERERARERPAVCLLLNMFLSVTIEEKTLNLRERHTHYCSSYKPEPKAIH